MSNRQSLENVSCYNCGATLKKGQLVIVSETPLALVAHAVCYQCGAQSMLTMTPSGVGSVPMVSDLEASEIKRFLEMDLISYDEILDLHKELKGTNICSLLQKNENNLEKKQKGLGKIEKSRQ
ncbi:hypothetical protein GF360_00825 [candidate division WWE3 bacterium]|nr:hypothetical protein [candidate division WWE3 bacterium]